MLTQSSTRQKRHHSKVTSGCLTCRLRRVKCDEQRPRCKKCIRLGRLCRGLGYGDDLDTSYNVHMTSGWPSEASEGTIGQPLVTTPSSVIRVQHERDQSHFLPKTATQDGHIRPFDSSYMSNITCEDFHLLDYFASQIWTVFYSTNELPDLHNLKQHETVRVCNNQAVWYTFRHAGAGHQTFLQNDLSDSEPDEKRLVLKQNAIQAVIKATKSVLDKHEIIDSYLAALITIASHSLGDSVRKEKIAAVQAQKPLICISCAEFYDALELTVEHKNAFFTLLEQRGGIHAITNTTLRVAVVRFGIYTSYRALEALRFDRIQPLSNIFIFPTSTPGISKQAKSTNLIRGFFNDIFHDTDIDAATGILIQIMQALIAITQDQQLIIAADVRKKTSNIHSLLNPDGHGQMQDVHQPSPFRLQKINLVWNRCIIMWELLSLPNRTHDVLSSTHPAQSILVYELCRIACFMYFQMLIWVIASPKINMARQLLSRIQPLLAASISPSIEAGTALYQAHPHFFVWIVTLSVVMAYEDYDQTGDAAHMKYIVPCLQRFPVEPRPNTWSDIVDALNDFLWSGVDCDSLGKDAWVFACSFI